MFSSRSLYGATLAANKVSSVPGVDYDPYWDYTTMLLSADGTANASQNNTFTFAAGGAGSITRSGTPTVGQFAPYTTAGWASMQFNGGTSTSNLDYISMPSKAEYAIGGGTDFTIECWVYVNQFSGGFFPVWQADVSLVGSSGTMWFGATAAGIDIGKHGGGNPNISFTGATLNTGVWYHIAVTRQSGSTRGFVNGKLIGTSAAFNGTAFSQNGALLGMRITPNFAFGNISNFRLVNGTALYTADFTPSTTPLTGVAGTAILLTNADAGIVDKAAKSDIVTVGSAQVSTATKKYGTGSISFPSSGSYLTTLSTQTGASYSPTPTMGSILTGDFTVEMWVNFTAGQTSGVRTLMGQWNQANASTAGWLLRSNAGSFEFYFAPQTQASPVVSGGSVVAGTWQHLAVTRSGNTVRLFVNGSLISTNTGVTAHGSPINIPYSFGNYYSASGTLPASGVTDFIGFMDDVRVTIGVARYTAAFTAPTAAFPTTGATVSPAAGTISATGGDVWFRGNYKYHVFKSSGSLTVTNITGSPTLEVLAIGGGGGGAGGGTSVGGGGGGGGGFLQTSQAIAVAETLTVTVGAAAAGGGANTTGVAGNNTLISGTNFAALTAIGGGRGGTAPGTAGNGGSGGGYSGTAANAPGTGTVGQGFDGGKGTGTYGSTACTGGGGGGAGGVGADQTGGFGKASDFMVNMPGWYARGGAGGPSGSFSPTARAANSGDGGIGAGSNGTGSTSGSGILIVRYKYV